MTRLPRYSYYFFRALFSPKLVVFLLVGALSLIVGSFAFCYFEAGNNPNVHGFWDSLWWGMVTISTVGYGDIAPTTLGGRLSSLFLMFTGLLIFISFSALFVSIFFLEMEEDVNRTQSRQQSDLEKIREELVVIRKELARIQPQNTEGKES